MLVWFRVKTFFVLRALSVVRSVCFARSAGFQLVRPPDREPDRLARLLASVHLWVCHSFPSFPRVGAQVCTAERTLDSVGGE
jgi:hypothetical protein